MEHGVQGRAYALASECRVYNQGIDERAGLGPWRPPGNRVSDDLSVLLFRHPFGAVPAHELTFVVIVKLSWRDLLLLFLQPFSRNWLGPDQI
ncbi:hypothetical protein D3C84_1046560 [compost metagenome]